MSNKNKKTEKIEEVKTNLFKGFTDNKKDLLKSLIIIIFVVISTIGFTIEKNKNHKLQSELANKIEQLKIKNDSINQLNKNIIELSNKITALDYQIKYISDKYNKIQNLYFSLKQDRNDLVNSVSKELITMQKQIYSLNNTVNKIKQNLTHNKKARKTK